MYVDPFVAGVIATITLELAALVIWAAYNSRKK